VILDFKKPFDLTLEHISSYDEKFSAQKALKNPSFSLKTEPSPDWSQLLNVVRTYFEEKCP